MASVLAGSSALAAEAPPREVTALADQFFTSVKAGYAGDAFRSALVNLGAEIGDGNLRTASAQAQDNLAKIGDVLGWSLIRTAYISPELVDQTYMLKGSKIPMFFRFAIYNSGISWRIIDIRYAPYADAEKSGYFAPANVGAH